MKNLLTYILFVLITTSGGILGMNEKELVFEFDLNAPVEEVYKSWTMPEGIKTFFAPGCEIELKLFGPYHIYFFPDSPVGQRGAEDEKVISFEKNKMLSFTWGFPPSLMDLRMNQKTIVRIRFYDNNDGTTKVIFKQTGWGESEEWSKGYEYFKEAWGSGVLARLRYRFENGPIDWGNTLDYSGKRLGE